MISIGFIYYKFLSYRLTFFGWCSVFCNQNLYFLDWWNFVLYFEAQICISTSVNAATLSQIVHVLVLVLSNTNSTSELPVPHWCLLRMLYVLSLSSWPEVFTQRFSEDHLKPAEVVWFSSSSIIYYWFQKLYWCAEEWPSHLQRMLWNLMNFDSQ